MDFIGLGAQKAGTSWIYACLYEHPELCLPFKEIHFFSRDRYKKKGIGWYEEQFSSCQNDLLRGEFSTSYLYSTEAVERIRKDFPDAKLIVSLRNPVTRAFSHYRNAIKAGEIFKDESFEEMCKKDKSVVGQGMYADQLQRYFDIFPRENILVLIYEDAKRDPKVFIQSIYRFLGVDASFVPTMLHRQINTSRTPKAVWVDKSMVAIARCMRKVGLQKVVWGVKKRGLADGIRKKNTEQSPAQKMGGEIEKKLKDVFREDVRTLGSLLERDLISEWGI